MMPLAIITGDIVGSRKILSLSRQRLYSDLKKFLTTLKKEKRISSYEMFRGDSIQCVVENKECVLRAALLIRAFIKCYKSKENEKTSKKSASKDGINTKGYFSGKHDIRLSIGIGAVDFYSVNNLAHSDGEAFRFSGEELDNIKKAQYRIALKTVDADFNEAMEPAILLLDAVMQKWTNNQAETVLYKLKSLKEEEIGKVLKISQPAVNQRIKTSQWYAIEKLLNYFENKVKDWK